MKDISKINVRHFLNRNLPTKVGDKVLYPTYVKITFQRKSTEIKSTINKSFESENDSEFCFSPTLAYESKMIQHFVEKGFRTLGDKFSLRGIAEICRKYHDKRIKDLFESFVTNDFNLSIFDIDNNLGRVIIWRNQNLPLSLYYDAAIKLFDNHKDIVKYKSQFEIIRDIESIIFAGFGELLEQRIIFWQFGTTKDMFLLEAKVKGLSEQRINSVISMIDSELYKLEQ